MIASGLWPIRKLVADLLHADRKAFRELAEAIKAAAVAGIEEQKP